MTGNGKVRTAILLYGFLRTAEETVGSMHRNLIEPNGADVFFFGPNASDNPSSEHKGILDGSGYVKINPKNNATEIIGNIDVRLRNIYGNALTDYKLHDKKPEFFAQLVSFVDKEQWLFSLNPMRFGSMFFNMEGAYNVMKEHEEKMGFKYDRVILTRPDLSFYEEIRTDSLKNGTVYIPEGEGFCPHTGNKNVGLSQVLFYVNRSSGTRVPMGVGFNDQLLVLTRRDAQAFDGLLDCIISYMKQRVPLTPETLMYYHLVVMNKMKVRYVQNWVYEIVRSDDAKIKNIVDLVVLDLIDKYHPAVIRRAKKQPIKYFLKFARIRYKAIKRRFFN